MGADDLVMTIFSSGEESGAEAQPKKEVKQKKTVLKRPEPESSSSEEESDEDLGIAEDFELFSAPSKDTQSPWDLTSALKKGKGHDVGFHLVTNSSYSSVRHNYR